MTGLRNAQTSLDIRDKVSFQTLGWGSVSTQSSSQLMQRVLALFPLQLLGGNLLPWKQEESISCLLIYKIKAHPWTSKIISSQKTPAGRLIHLCGVLSSSLKTYNQFFWVLLLCASHSFKEMHRLDRVKCVYHRSTAKPSSQLYAKLMPPALLW